MSSYELGRRMYHDIRTMLYRSDKIRCTESIVNNQRQIMFVRNFSHCINIRNVTVWVTQCFKIYSACIILYCIFDFFRIVCVYKGCCNSVARKCMSQQIVCTAVNCLLGNDMSAACCKSLNCICDCRSSRSKCKCRNTAL